MVLVSSDRLAANYQHAFGEEVVGIRYGCQSVNSPVNFSGFHLVSPGFQERHLFAKNRFDSLDILLYRCYIYGVFLFLSITGLQRHQLPSTGYYRAWHAGNRLFLFYQRVCISA